MITTIDIIIVNWNSGKLLFECLNSFKGISHENFSIKKIIIIDNNSQDDSLERIDEFDLPILLYRNNENVGFAKASNQGVKFSDAEYILFLNPDTRLYRNSISEPINFMMMENNSEAGIVGIKLIDENNAVSKNCASFLTPSKAIIISLGLDKILPRYFKGLFLSDWDHLDSRIVDQVMGSFYLIRRKLL